jgi:hypothetical protein
MNRKKTTRVPSGLPGSLPASLFIEKDSAKMVPQDFQVLEPEDSIPIQTPSTVTVEGLPQIDSTASSGQRKNPLILSALPTGGMKSPCTSAPSLYQNRESVQDKNDWLDAIARDDLRDARKARGV